MEQPALRIRLLGTFEMQQDGVRAVQLESARAVSLLAHLILRRGTPQTRRHLAFLLWPDSAESQSRTNLRHVFHNLRRAIPGFEDLVDITLQTLCWRPDAPVWLDVAEFDALLEHASRDERTALSVLQQAVELYRGDLLEGYYDEWLLGERERLRLRYREALIRIVQLMEEQGVPHQALSYAERLLRHDVLDEASYRILMRLHDACGNRARAARVYHECVAILRRELGVDPSGRTVAVYESLLPRNLEPDTPRQHLTRESGPPLVGRREERERLIQLWRASARGEPKLVALRGEAGAGKTRLAEELAAWCIHQGARVATARAYAAEGALGFGPVVTWLRAPAVSDHQLALPPDTLSDVSRILPELATLPGVPAPEPLPESDYRRRVYDALARALLAGDEPLLLVADDLQWFDPESLKFLHYLLRVAARSRLLVAATVREEEIDAVHPVGELFAGLRSLDRYAELPIGRLTRVETGRLAAELVDGGVTDAQVEDLFRETEGNPLFLVETIRAGWDSRAGSQRPMSPRVQSVIRSRLLQLSEAARGLVGVAATIGRAFSAETLKRASGLDEQSLVRCLDELWRRHVIDEQGIDGYDFTHDKIREVAYLELGPALRRRLHAGVAAALEQQHAEDASSVSGQIAVHLDRAGLIEQAVDWYQRAADVSGQMRANAEAVGFLQRGIELLRGLPPSRERQQRELELLTALPGPLTALEGYQSRYVSGVHQRVLELTGELGIEPSPPLLWSLAVANLPLGNFDAARHYGRMLRARAERDDDAVLVVQADYVLGIIAYWSAEFEAARANFEAVLERYRPEDRREHLLRYGQDPSVICQMRLAFTLWFLGRADEATRLRDDAVERIADVEHWFTRLSVLHFAFLLAVETREDDLAREGVRIISRTRNEYEAAYIEHIANALEGYVETLDGRPEAGIARLRWALDDLRSGIHMPGQWSSVSRLLLAACDVIGDARAGLDAVECLLDGRDGVRIWDAEAWRMKAELLERLEPGSATVDEALRHALDIARRQQAKSLELRVAMSMLRIGAARADTGATSDARNLLARLVEAMAASAAPVDLAEARVLLASTA